MGFKRFLRSAVVLLLSSLLSALIAEGAVRYIFGFPQLGVRRIVRIYPHDRYLGRKSFENLYYPHTRFFHSEAGFNIYEYNNVGLPGIDVDLMNRKIFVLGNSFIEARAIGPDNLATSVLQRLLSRNGMHYNVFNLGKSGHIPCAAYYRMKYWKHRYKPDMVILVLEEYMLGNLSRTFEFINYEEINSVKNTEVKGKEFLGAKMCTVSALVNLFRNGIKHSNVKNEENDRQRPEQVNRVTKDKSEETDRVMKGILSDLKYFTQEDIKLFVFSLLEDEYNEKLSNFCEDEHIPFGFNSELRNDRKLLINGKGHFNEQGHYRLGEALFKFINNYAEHVQGCD